MARPAVVIVSSHATGGGSERYLELLLGELGRDEVRGIISLQEGPFVHRVRALGYHVDVVPAPARVGLVRAAVQLQRVVRAMRPDVVHANGIKAALTCALAPALGAPLVWVKHDFSWDGPLARFVAARSRLVIAVSHAITATFGARQRTKIRVIPNGVPALRRDPDGRRAVDELVGRGGPIALLVGRIHSAKGQLELVEAAPGVLRLRPDVRFLLVGGEDPTQAAYTRRLQERIAELRIEESVTLAGHRDDPLRLMSGADVVVLPSVVDDRGAGREACPFALLEAMSVETPVVAYATGGIPEVLGDCGRLVPEGDRDALARAIVELVDDEEVRKRAAARGRTRVRARHGLSRTVAHLRRVYAEAASG